MHPVSYCVLKMKKLSLRVVSQHDTAHTCMGKSFGARSSPGALSSTGTGTTPSARDSWWSCRGSDSVSLFP